MINPALILVTVFAGLTSGSPPSAPAGQDTTAAPQATATAQSVYRREKFVYPTDNRRNPFVSLLEADDAGPQFTDLDLVGVIFGGSAGSVATLIDRATEKRYRVRRGDSVGSARVVEIRPDAVVFQVTEFGLTRSETLRIRREEEEQG